MTAAGASEPGQVATYLDGQARLFFWYRNRSRRDYYVQGWKPGRIGSRRPGRGRRTARLLRAGLEEWKLRLNALLAG